MKRHITVEQFNELSDEQKQKLRSWWRPKEYDLYTDDDGNYDAWEVDYDGSYCFDEVKKQRLSYDEEATDMYPLLSIGQMIEFLEGKFDRIENDGITWEVQMKKNNAWYGINREEFCDALWEAVKETLNED